MATKPPPCNQPAMVISALQVSPLKNFWKFTLSPFAGTPRRFEQHAPRAKKANMFEAVTPFQPAAAQLIDYEGNYVSEEIDPVYRVSVEDGKLTLLYLKHKSETLHPLVRDTFVGDIGKLRFTRDAKGRVTGLTLDTGRIQNFTFTKKAS